MELINVGWKKQAPDEVQFYSGKQQAQYQSLNKIKKQTKIKNKRKVQFMPQQLDDEEEKCKNTFLSSSFAFEDNDFNSSSTKLCENEISITKNRPLCSVRVTIVTFIMVVFIILAAATSIGIMFGILNSQQNSSASNSQNNNQNSLSTISTMSMTSSISIGTQNGTPCTSYTTINDPTRNIANNIVYGICDRNSIFNASSDGSWIRFVGSGGTIIPMTSPGEGHCGGFTSGWFNGTLPTTVGNVINGTVCFAVNFMQCFADINISIVNCGGYYVYLLPPVYFCNGRYCTT